MFLPDKLFEHFTQSNSLPFHLQVLQLSHISFVSSAPEGGSMHIDVSTAMAYIHVSPPTIRTLTACLMSLAPAKVCVAYRIIGKNALGRFVCLINMLIRIVFERFLCLVKSFSTLSLPRFHYWISLQIDRQFPWCCFGEFVIGSTDNPFADIFLYSHHLLLHIVLLMWWEVVSWSLVGVMGSRNHP